MSKIVFKQNVIDSLYQSVKSNLSRYIESKDSWVEELYPDRSLYATTKLPELSDDLLLVPDGAELFDEENARRLYSALSGITLTQASDPRLWTYLTHVKFWRYMKARWPIKPIDGDSETVAKRSATRVGTITSRYFLLGDKSRGLTRNGIARLWWAGYTCHVREHADEYRYAKTLFATQDVYASLMERAFSKNRKIIQPVLSVLTKRLEAGTPFDDRDKVRDLSKHLVLLGGAMVLDVLDPPAIQHLVERFISEQETTAE